jgi:4-aminobutyrate aminotransferase/(S)-3-amino-2-methylpropionate transaminase
MIAFDVVTAAGLPDAESARKVAAAALQDGLILLTCGVYGNTIRLLFPLVIPDVLFSEGLAKLEKAITATLIG